MTRAGFEERVVYRTGHVRRLRVPRQAQFEFLKEGGCSVHPAKPLQCAAFPLWPELVASKREWKKTARYCPGIGKGPLVQIEIAQAVAHAMREGHPGLYQQAS